MACAGLLNKIALALQHAVLITLGAIQVSSKVFRRRQCSVLLYSRLAFMAK